MTYSKGGVQSIEESVTGWFSFSGSFTFSMDNAVCEEICF